MEGLPEGTLTFLFTDLEGSTRAWEESPAVMRQSVARHDRIVADAVAEHRGIDVHSGRAGDSTLAVFHRATDAAACALGIQRAFARESWPPGGDLKIRVAFHTGEAQLRDRQYYGQALNRCARLLATGHGGQILLTHAAEELIVDDLPPGGELKDLGFHRLKDLTRTEHVFELVDRENPRQFPPIRSMRRQLSNLPFQLTTFVGRDSELAELRNALPQLRLLTLTGPAGAGKTRLAVQLGWEFVTNYPDGVWLVELGAIDDHRLVPQQLAGALELQEQPGRPLRETLREQLAERRMLIVLDNCEHVIGAVAALVSELLQQSERLAVLATSREPLRIAGEVVKRIGALDREDALQLFAARARVHRSPFAVSDDNVQLIDRICQRLDRLPLAIELAAARAGTISLDEIFARLEERFSLLTVGERGGPARARTLRTAIDWSHELLARDEQILFRRLSTFADRFPLDAVEIVCPDTSLARPAILDALESLVDKSMVVAEDGRYRCLETLRAYGRERLDAAGERDAMNAALGRYLLAVAQQRTAGRLAAWLDRLDEWHEDVLATLNWSLEHDHELGATLASALYVFWQLRGHAAEPREFSEALLRRVANDFAQRAALLHVAGAFAYLQADLQTARRRLQEAIVVARASGDQITELRALETAGLVEVAGGDINGAEAALEDALTMAKALDRPESEAAILHQLGLLASRRGEQQRARSLFARSIEIRRSLGRSDEASMPLTFLSAVALLEGDFETARRSIIESLQIGRALRDRRASWSLDVVACIVSTEGKPELALRLAGAGAAMHEAAGNRPPESWDLFTSALLQPAREALGDEAATAAFDAGKRLPVDEVFELALGAGVPTASAVGAREQGLSSTVS